MSSPIDISDPVVAAIYQHAMRSINEIVARMNMDLLQHTLRCYRQQQSQYIQPTLWEAA